MHSFRDLKVWQKSHALTLEIYQVTGSFPRHELFGLTGQMRRAASSIGLNLAEGGGKATGLDQANYVQRAIGSSCELEYAALLVRDLGHIDAERHDDWTAELVEIRRMLYGLANHLRRE